MILYLRLLAGLTNRFENLWLAHFSSREPSGILASSRVVISVSYQAEEDGQRHRDVADGDEGGQTDGQVAPPSVEAGVVDAQALEHRPGPVEDVGGEGDVGQDVEGGHRRPGEGGDEVGVDLAPLPAVGGEGLDAPCQVGQVEEDKDQHDHA